MATTYDDLGVRFRYPDGWQVEVSDDGGSVTTVAIQSPTGPAFALVTIDDSRPDPNEVADGSLDVMREEYPVLDAEAARETIGGHPAVGHDIEFFSLDVANACAIRCFRTDRRTVLVFGQWSDLEGAEAEDAVAALRRSFEETDVE